MRVEIRRRVNRNTGVTTFHYIRVDRKNGRTVRRYVRRGELTKPLIEQFNFKKDKLVRSALRKFEKAVKGKSTSRCAVGKELEGSGLGINSHGRVSRSRKTFFTAEAAACRFALLDAPLKETLGSPENLLMLERKADSLLHSARRKGLKGITFEACFRHVLDDPPPR